MTKKMILLFFGILLIGTISAFDWSDGRIVAYYKLDNSTGDFYDMQRAFDIQNNGATQGVTGKINNSVDFESGDPDYANTSFYDFDTTEHYSYAVWLKVESLPASSYSVPITMANGVGSGSFDRNIRVYSSSGNICFGNTLVCLGGYTGNWIYVVGTYNGTLNTIYLNGTLINSTTASAGSNWANPTLELAFTEGSLTRYDGMIDELGIWNRSLTADEVLELWNGGSGVPYETTPTLLNITLNSPIDNYPFYETDYRNITLNASAKGSETATLSGVYYNLTNFSFYTNLSGSWAKNYTIDLTGTNTNFTTQTLEITLPTDEGILWGVQACDNSGNCSFSNNRTITYTEIAFGLCNATLTTPFINFTFKDESDSSSTTGQFSNAEFVYWLNERSLNKTYTYINNTNSTYYAFCFSPSNRNLNVDMYVQYRNSGSPQRIYDPTTTTLTNSTTNKTLYLLATDDGLYVTFQVLNTAGQQLSGVSVNATRIIDSETVLVGQGTTGASGTVTFWLNPDFEHTFSFSKTGYDTYSYSDTPTQSSYSVTLSGGETEVTESYTKGITKYILPINSSLVNGTTYTFGIQINSSYWDLDSYGFNLRLRNGTIITGNTTTTEGNLIVINYNTENQTRIYLDYYWVVEGNYTNRTIYWNVYNTEYSQWSIKYFFTDLSSYINSDLFGIDEFGRKLFIFLILFVSIGTLSYKYGVNSLLFLSAVIFGVVFFFDVAVGIIPTYVTNSGREIQHLYTFISGLIFALVGIREVTR